MARGLIDRAEQELRDALAIECEILAERRPEHAAELSSKAASLRGDTPPAGAFIGALEVIDEAAPTFLHGIPRRVDDLSKLLAARGQEEAAVAVRSRYGRDFLPPARAALRR